MVYRFKIVSEEVDNFCREIEIDSEAYFLDFRNSILESVGFPKDELNSFFLCDEDWNKEEEITLEDSGDTRSDMDLWIMADTRLSELVEDEGQHLTFLFDFDGEREFLLELKEIITGKTLLDPLCTRKVGRPPLQHIVEEEEPAPVVKTPQPLPEDATPEDNEFDFLNETEFDEEDMPEGFEEF